jgi:serine/threonine-protein kinase
MGSVHYASPEQARNGYVSNKSDIYSLGIVMYEMVTGRVPFDGESTVAVAIQHLQDEMVAPSEYAKDLPISLEKIILKCTQKSPDRRYDSMESLLIDLRKSLLNPDEDFVTLVPYTQDKTRVVSEEEVKEIQEKTAGVTADTASATHNDKDGDDDDYDDEDYDDEDYDDDDYDDDDEDEEGGFFNSRMEKIVGVMRIVVAIIIILIVIYLVGSFFDIFKFSFGSKKKTEEPATQISAEQEDTVVMIDLKEMTVDEAQEALEEMGLSLNVSETETSEEYEEGVILDQDVQEGEAVAVGTTINVTVSSGKEEAEEVKIEDVTGQQYDSAKSALEALGLTVNREFEYSSEVATGKVIRQDPAAGTTVTKNTTVTLYVSQGNESVKVPSVLGYTEADAKAALSNLNVQVTSQYSDSVEAGKVISQDPSEGKYVDKGSTINLVVSLGPESVSYYLETTVKAPENVTIEYADIELYLAESDELVQSWAHVTSFPYSLSAHGITESSEGTVVITWYYTDANGNEQSQTQESSVSFKKE